MSEQIDELLKDYLTANDKSYGGIFIKLILPAITFLDSRLDIIDKYQERILKMLAGK